MIARIFSPLFVLHAPSGPRLTIILDAFLNRGRANVIRFGNDVGKNGSGANARDAASGGEKCVRRRDDRVAWPNSKRH